MSIVLSSNNYIFLSFRRKSLLFNRRMNSIYLTLVLVFCVNLLDGAKILILYPLGLKSHWNVIQPLVHALADRGHDLTVVTSISTKSLLPPNIKEINPFPGADVGDLFGNTFDVRKMGRLAFAASFNKEAIMERVENGYNDLEFQNVISQKYDLVIMNGFFNEGFLGVIDKIGAPYILVTAMPSPLQLVKFTGNYLPSSFVPIPFWDFTDRMTFPERLLNYLLNNVFGILNQPLYKKYETLYRSRLGQDTLGINSIYGNVSLIFMNTHFSLNYPRPNFPDNIEIGGMHCRPARPLPTELNNFLSGAEHGFIYFSLGSVVQTNEMPEEYRKVFANVFGRLKQRVIWKWETEEMSNLPPNVKLSKWLPQQDILGHPNIRVFMTHGGLLSTQEAAYHGVPLLGIPIFSDQDVNMKHASAKGYAITLEILNVTEIDLENKLKLLLEEPRFTTTAKELSSIVRDQLDTPLERAVYWSEYVIRHKGASHLRSAARNLNHLQAHSYDVIAFLATIAITFVLIVKACFTRICKCLWRTKSNKSFMKKVN